MIYIIYASKSYQLLSDINIVCETCMVPSPSLYLDLGLKIPCQRPNGRVGLKIGCTYRKRMQCRSDAWGHRARLRDKRLPSGHTILYNAATHNQRMFRPNKEKKNRIWKTYTSIYYNNSFPSSNNISYFFLSIGLGVSPICFCYQELKLRQQHNTLQHEDNRMMGRAKIIYIDIHK